MENDRRPLRLAYIIFLVASIIYYFLSIKYNLEYESWSRIVVAATTSSYFFAISEMTKSTLDIEKDNIEVYKDRELLYLEQINLLNQLEGYEKKKLHTEKMLKSTRWWLNRFAKEIKGSERYIFRTDVEGFVAFLFVIAFEPVYTFLIKYQEIYTMLAFLNIFLIDYFNPLIKNHLRGLTTKFNDGIVKDINKIKILVEAKYNKGE